MLVTLQRVSCLILDPTTLPTSGERISSNAAHPIASGIPKSNRTFHLNRWVVSRFFVGRPCSDKIPLSGVGRGFLSLGFAMMVGY